MPNKPKGLPKTGGRQKGTPNKDVLGLEERAKTLGVDVFEILVYFVSGNWKALGYENEVFVIETAAGAHKLGYTITPEMRLKASTELMKYIYPTKKAVELSTADTGIKVVIEDYSKKE